MNVHGSGGCIRALRPDLGVGSGAGCGVGTVVAARLRNKTYADYLALPAGGTKAEPIDGELCRSPTPKGYHVRVASMLGARLAVSFGFHPAPTSEGPGGWWIFDEPECQLSVDRRVVRPDLAGWRRERMPEPPADTHKFLTVPDWVCEVLSPATQGHDMLRKMPLYLAAGVDWAWIVDPVARSNASQPVRPWPDDMQICRGE